MRKQDGRDEASMQADGVNILKAWAIYFLLKCAVVTFAMHIGEHLGFLVVSVVEGPSLQEGVETAWAALAVYYSVVAVVAAFLFKWAVSRFVVSKIVREMPVRLSLFHYVRAWVVYASITFALVYLIALVLEYTILELMLGSLVSLLVFRWTVIKLLLADRTALAST